MIINFLDHKVKKLVNDFEETGYINIASRWHDDLERHIEELNRATNFRFSEGLDKIRKIYVPYTAETIEEEEYAMCKHDFNSMCDRLLINTYTFNSPLLTDEGNQVIDLLMHLEMAVASEEVSDFQYEIIHLAMQNREKLVFILKEALDELARFLVKWESSSSNQKILGFLNVVFEERSRILNRLKSFAEKFQSLSCQNPT